MTWKLKDSGSVISIRWIPRYDGMERVLHWGHTVAFLPLTLTGMVLFVPAFAPLAQGQAGQFIRLLHRIFAAFFILTPILYALSRPRRLVNTVRDLKFSRYDMMWFKAALPYLVLGHTGDMPPQGRFNAGQKVNLIILVSGTILFSITGLIMWFGKFVVPTDLFRAAVILHDLTMIASVNMFIVHFYLTVAHPMMWESLISMRFGVVSDSYAREHHAAWFYGEERARKLYEEKQAARQQDLTERGKHNTPPSQPI